MLLIDKTIVFFLLFLVVLSACGKKIQDIHMFGIPVSNTGLNSVNCNTDCKESKQFSEDEFNFLRTYSNTQNIAEILENPYNQEITKNTEGVCAVVIEDRINKLYHLETFENEATAKAAGAIVTHIDACGACSTLQDLAVYAERLDLGAEVRKCGMQNLTKPFDSLLVCIENIGFTRPCAQIWTYNTKNTQAKCFSQCITNNRYNKKNGNLSQCLQCDETKSGPVFKAVAGRTRRNTGIANAICRFCEDVQTVEHNYNF